MAGSVRPAASRRRISASRGVNEMPWALVGGTRGSSASAIACAGVRARPAAQAVANGGHGVLQRHLIFLHAKAQP